MKMHDDGLVAYRYTNPDNDYARVWRVQPILPNDPHLPVRAAAWQRVASRAWKDLLPPEAHPEIIDGEFNPENNELVDRQVAEMAGSDIYAGPRYIAAFVEKDMDAPIQRTKDIIAVGRVGLQRYNQLGGRYWYSRRPVANIGSIAVDPTINRLGIGKSMWRSALDNFPDDYDTVAAAFAWDKVDMSEMGQVVIAAMLKEHKFQMLKGTDIKRFGGALTQELYIGPQVGELKAIFDQKDYIANREAIVA